MIRSRTDKSVYQRKGVWKLKLSQMNVTSALIAGIGVCLCGATLNAQDCPPAEKHKVSASIPSVSEYAESIAIGGDYVFVGAGEADGITSISGEAYLYDRETGTELFRWVGSDGNENGRFGASGAISGNSVLVGAYFNDNVNGDFAGAVFLYDAVTGAELNKFIAGDGAYAQRFGIDVDLDGDIALIGANGDGDGGVDSGAAYVIDMTTGAELFKLTASDPAETDYFGSSVTIEGDYAIVGAWNKDVDGVDSIGAVYVFDITTGQELFKLVGSHTDSFSRFGKKGAVGASGDIVTIGAPGLFSKGEAYVFDLTTGNQLVRIKADDGKTMDLFGDGVSMNEDYILIGAWGDDNNGSESGSVYMYDATTGSLLHHIMPADADTGDDFGWAIVQDDSSAVIAAPGVDGTIGAAYIYDLAPQTCPWLTVSPEPLIAGQNGTFTAINMTPDENAYLVYSTVGLGSTFVPPLNITLDIKQPKQAGNTQMADGSGFVEWVLPIPGAAVGRNVWFQVAQFENKTNAVATSVVQ